MKVRFVKKNGVVKIDLEEEIFGFAIAVATSKSSAEVIEYHMMLSMEAAKLLRDMLDKEIKKAEGVK